MRTRWWLQISITSAAIATGACTTTPMTPEMIAYAHDRPLMVPPSAGGPAGTAAPGAPLSCVPYARQVSGIALYGDAYTWWDQADGRYAREPVPRAGALLVLSGYAGPKRAHLAYVTRIISPREIRVDHANWLNDGNIYLNSPVIDVSHANDWSEVRVWNNRDGHLGIKNYNVQGFITPFEIALRPPLS